MFETVQIRLSRLEGDAKNVTSHQFTLQGALRCHHGGSRRSTVTDVALKHQKCGETTRQENFVVLCCDVVKLLTSQHPHCGSLQAAVLGRVFPGINPVFSSSASLPEEGGPLTPIPDRLAF